MDFYQERDRINNFRLTLIVAPACMCCNEPRTMSYFYPMLFGSLWFLAYKHKLPHWCFVAGKGFLLLERPVETDGRFTNAGRGRERSWQRHTSERFPSTTGFLSSSRLALWWRSPLLPKWAEKDNVTTSALTLSREAKTSTLSVAIAIKERLSKLAIYQNIHIDSHSYRQPQLYLSNCLGNWKKLMNIYFLPSFLSSVISSVCLWNEPVASSFIAFVRVCVWRGRRQ